MIPNVLTIAGSDPSGGAGIQADLKTFSALGCFGTSVITALTAQNTRGVTGIHAVPPAFVAGQIDTLFADVRIDAVKIGMVGDPEAAMTIADRLRHHQAQHVVVDPVMVAKGGARLISDEAVSALRRDLLPIAFVITPNLPEAAALLGQTEAGTPEEMVRFAADLHRLGPRYVLVKGGHLPGTECVDVLHDGTSARIYRSLRIETPNTHGTGCTLSSAIAAFLAKGLSVPEAVERAKAYITEAIEASRRLSVGSGHGPVHHFVRLWK